MSESRLKPAYLNDPDFVRDLHDMRSSVTNTALDQSPMALQLRLSPFAVDPTIEKSTAEVDYDAETVRFRWVGSKADHASKRYRDRLDRLAEVVRSMVGKDWKVEVWALDSDGKQRIFPYGEDGRGSRKVSAKRPRRVKPRRGRGVQKTPRR